jgi:hypothetical protein
MLICLVIREKKQRFEVIRGCMVFIGGCFILHTIPNQPGTLIVNPGLVSESVLGFTLILR